MLPAPWQIFAVMHKYNILIFLLLLSIPFLFLFFKSGIDKSTERSTIPTCPRLICLFNWSNTEGTNTSKFLCLMFVCVFLLLLLFVCFLFCFVFYKFVSGLIL